MSTSKSTVSSLDIGNLLKIYSTKGIYNNLATASELWKFMEKKRVAKPEGREVRYLLRDKRGQTAFQFLAPGAEGSFPAADRTSQQEATAYFKDFGTTIDIPRHLLNKSGSDLAAYAQPLAEELDAKGTATARGLSRTLCGDGTGALGKISAVSVSSAKLLVTLSSTSADAGRSHVGWFEYGEKVQITSNAGAVQQVTDSGGAVTPIYCIVDSVDTANNQVTLSVYESGDVLVTVTAVNEVGSGDYIYPYGAGSTAHINDLSSVTTDYGLLSFALCGLESLAADDSRTVNGLTMTGAISGSRTDASGDVIDRTHFQSALSMAKRRCNGHAYKWNTAFMFDDTYDAMMESWETDRMIISASDTNRGASGELGYKHGKDLVKFTPDEFVQKNRIWMVPEGDVLQYRGTGIDQVNVDGAKFFMPNDSSGNHQRLVRAYLEGSGLLFATHPAAIACIENFIV